MQEDCVTLPRGLQKTGISICAQTQEREKLGPRSLNSAPIKTTSIILFLKLILTLAFKELKSMEHYLLVTVEHPQCNLTNQQGPAFVRWQRCFQVNLIKGFCLFGPY